MSQNELLPCPFCGGAATRYEYQHDRGWDSNVLCGNDDCPASELIVSAATQEEADAAWNTRIEAAQAIAPGGGDESRGITLAWRPMLQWAIGTIDELNNGPMTADQWAEDAGLYASARSLAFNAAAAPASEAKWRDDLCCPVCEVTGFTMPIQHTEEMSFGRVIGLEADYCTNCGEAFVLPEKALRNEVKFNHARNHKPAASSAADIVDAVDDPHGECPTCHQALHVEQEQAGESPERLAEWVESAHEAFAMPDEELKGKLQQAAALLRRAARVEVDIVKIADVIQVNTGCGDSDSIYAATAVAAALEPKE